MKTMQEIDTIYQSEMSRARLEGEAIGRQKTMQEIDTVYQSEMSQAKSIGRQEGEAIGRQEQGLIFVMRLLNRRLRNISGDLSEQIKALPLERLEALGEDCLDFEQLSDLTSWLARNER